MSRISRPEMAVSLHEGTLGRRYRVTIGDCCIEMVEFTAVLVGWQVDPPEPGEEHDHEYDGAFFDNGVTISSGFNGGVALEELPDV